MESAGTPRSESDPGLAALALAKDGLETIRQHLARAEAHVAGGELQRAVTEFDLAANTSERIARDLRAAGDPAAASQAEPRQGGAQERTTATLAPDGDR